MTVTCIIKGMNNQTKNPYQLHRLLNQKFLCFFTPSILYNCSTKNAKYFSIHQSYNDVYISTMTVWNMTENENGKRKPSPVSYAKRRVWNAFILNFSSHPPWSDYSIFQLFSIHQKHFASILLHHLNINVLLWMGCELCIAHSLIFKDVD